MLLQSATPTLTNDGFTITVAESWFKVKVQLIQRYLRAFVTHCAGKSDEIIVVDLFAGCGLHALGDERELFAGSCLASLGDELPVSKWIFCERAPESAKALKIRVNRYFKGKNVLIFDDPLEHLCDKLQYYVPVSRRGYRVSVFCLVDPFSIDIPFSMLNDLQDRGFSFVIPFTFSLNDRHNYRFYIDVHREKLKKYLGGPEGIERFDDVKSNAEFYRRLVKTYQNNMLALGLNASLSSHKLDSGLMELPTYQIGFFSRQLSPKILQYDALEKDIIQFGLF
ncbi:MAG: three-Cys-motif partner protein TcmP [Cyclobacteriaceae bacterium]|nr:three-Cys-motif partner protein TcmP [Cyclobacteriaceae bacterium]